MSWTRKLPDIHHKYVLYFTKQKYTHVTPPNLINIQGHELEGAFIVHTLACLEIHGQMPCLQNRDAKFSELSADYC